MATVLPYIATALGLFSAYNQYQAANEARRLAEEQAKVTPQEASLYNQLANQLAWMAGLDPSRFFIQPTGGSIATPTPVQGQFSAIPEEAINEAIAQTQRDLARQTGTLSEQALANLARRGLAGSSLVDQAVANIGSEAAQQLSQARTNTEWQNQQLTRQYAQQALDMLMGLNQNNLAQTQTGLQSLLSQLGQEQAGWGSLLSSGLTYGLSGLGYDQNTGKLTWRPPMLNLFQ